MRNMLRCRRGAAALATVVALVPLIGFLALGAEGASWYVTKQRAQNAADAAAYSGGLWLACSLAPSSCVADTQSMDYRGKQFAAENAFCTSGDGTAYPGRHCASLPSGTSQAVTITPIGADSVQATVTQTQPAYLAKVLGLSTVTIGATAIAKVVQPAKLPCALALSGPITFQDAAVQVNAPNCGIASNGTPIGIDFKVAPKQLNVGSLSTAGGCTGSLCGSVSTFAAPVINPFTALTGAITGLTLPKCSGSTLKPYATGSCANDNITINSATSITDSGVYFFSGGLSLGGNGSLRTCTGAANDPDPVCITPIQLAKGQITATIIVLPVSGKTSLKMAGGSSFNITAPKTAPSALPSQLASVANLLSNMALFDPEASPQITGTSTMAGSGVFYLPNANPLNFQGDPTSAGSTCTEVIAASIKFSGTPNFDNSGCPESIKLKSQYVRLVQ